MGTRRGRPPGSGKPKKLNADLLIRIDELLRAGRSGLEVAAALGLHKSTIKEWCARGEREPGTVYAQLAALVAEIRRQRATGELAKPKRQNGPRVDQKLEYLKWYLVRRFPDLFGRVRSRESLEETRRTKDAELAETRALVIERFEHLFPDD